MTNQEFSNSLDVLLNSHNITPLFGDLTSIQDIVLDEYEKSVILTLAQDIIVKTFFDRKINSTGEGFDDSTKRQVDFSTLITVKELFPVEIKAASVVKNVDGRSFPIRYKGVALGFLRDIDSAQLYEKGTTFLNSRCTYDGESVLMDGINILRNNWEPDDVNLGTAYRIGNDYFVATINGWVNKESLTESAIAFDDRGIIYNMPYRKYPDFTNLDAEGNPTWVENTNSTDVLFILNERVSTIKVKNGKTIKKDYVVVPINYKEYSREMTKAYALPLKKQVWRLFLNNNQGFDYQSELIPRWNLTDTETIVSYKIRYIRRPVPIILTELSDDLAIDGFTKVQECELNPILHNEILLKAVEIALSTRGGRSTSSNQNTKQ